MRTLQVLAYGIPLAFLSYVLYINYLPFGYEKTFVIDVGAEGDTDSRNAFYLQPSPDLSERKVAPDGTTYRELNGIAYAVFKPPVVLKDAEITVTVEGEGVSIIPPVIDFNPDDYEWDYEWDFTNPDTAFTAKTSERARAEWQECTEDPNTGEDVCEQVPVPDLVGNAFWFDGGMYFDGNSRLELPGTADMFENGPFTVYVEWEPEKHSGERQLVGHFNWEIWQTNNGVRVSFGRMNDSDGKFVSIRAIVDEHFFGKRHSLLLTYDPATDFGGALSMRIDGNLVEQLPLRGDTIYAPYNGDKNLTFGRSDHRDKLPYVGNIHFVKIRNNVAVENQTRTTFPTNQQTYFYLPIEGIGKVRLLTLFTQF